ncbi:MAG: phosphoribosylanthranilate isomerase [Acidobacteriaceae bacterium]
MWTKICGNTTLEDAQLAVTHGADAVGFIFAEGPRRVTPEAVGKITGQLPRTIEKYGVFVDADFAAIVETVRVAGLTGVQLHAPDGSGIAERLRQHYAGRAGRFYILQVLHYAGDAEEFAAQLRRLRTNASIDAVLLDSRTATQQGGTGIAFDWSGAREVLAREAHPLRLIVAGGLRPENVQQAIATLRPWGVDVSSGVEARPGRKDPQRVAAFMQAARMAATKMEKADAAART